MEGSDPMLISATNKRPFDSSKLQDHHALIPLATITKECSYEENNIYTFVFQSFFNILKLPYVYNSVSIDVDISRHNFIGNGIEVINASWKMSADNDEEEDAKEDYSGLVQGVGYKVIAIQMQEDLTEPKKITPSRPCYSSWKTPAAITASTLQGLELRQRAARFSRNWLITNTPP
jgi:DNA topoisomerase-3